MNNTPHLALKLPEIVNQIVSCLITPYWQDQDKSRLYKHIYPCLFVNSLWHDCASRYLWKYIVFEDSASEYDSFLKFTSVVSNSPGIQHMQNEYSQWMTMFSNKYSQHYYRGTSSHVLDCSKEEIHGEIDSEPVYSHHVRYRSAVRSICLRKIKERSINKSLEQIAPYMQRLEKLDIYICDHLSDSSVQLFIQSNTFSTLTFLSLAGCSRVTDEAIIHAAMFCPKLSHLDLRACGHVSDKSISIVARRCPDLHHLNVGRVRDRERITMKSIGMIAKYTKVAVLGLAGCDMTDECLLLLAKYRGKALERISVNNCYRLTNKTVQAYAQYCPNLSVFEMKECHWIDDWASVAELVQRRVLLTLCDQQSRACSEWARRHGRVVEVRAPIK